jgi:predicted DNA-binding transcriptional regulator YafY
MTRLTRLTNILLHLQARRVVTSQELADKFGISQRTVYRDIKALEEAGVPIIGEAGTGYSLMDDYRIPPVMFTEQEINALLTAQKLLQKNSDKSVSKYIESVVTKVKAILRLTAKEKAEKLEQRVHVFSDEKTPATDFLSGIQSAIVNTWVLKIRYHTIYSDAVTERFIEPLAVYFTKEKWLLIAYCRSRKDLREFRIDRILDLRITSDTFTNRNFSFEDYMNQLSEKFNPS